MIFAVIVTIICLLISISLIVVTFICNFWLTVNSDSTKFGVWVYCQTSSGCIGWYNNTQGSYGSYFNDSYKVFQAFQTLFLGFSFVTMLMVVLSMVHCRQSARQFIVAACLEFLSAGPDIFLSILLLFYFDEKYIYVTLKFSLYTNFIMNFLPNEAILNYDSICGIISIVVFVTKTYNNSIHTLGWCYWISIVAIFCTLNSAIFTFFYVTFDLKLQKKNSLKKSTSSSLEKLQTSFDKPINPDASFTNWNDNWSRKPVSNSDTESRNKKTTSSNAARTSITESDNPNSFTPKSKPRNVSGSFTKSKAKYSDRSSFNRKSDTDSEQKDLRFKSKFNSSIKKDRSLSKRKNKTEQYKSSVSNSESDPMRFDRKIASKQNAKTPKYTFYNGSKSYKSNIVLNADFINETLKKAKYINTRPLDRLKRMK